MATHGDQVAQTMTTQELAARLGTKESPVVVDVREPDEFASWSIPGSVNIPVAAVEKNLDKLRNGEVVVVCASGRRSTLVTEQLRGAGIGVRNLLGGMGAWADTYDHVTFSAASATVVQIRRRGKGCLSYVVGANGEALVIDPTAELEEYLSIAKENGWTIRHIVDTHLHADHFSGARALREATGATLYLSKAEPYAYEFAPLLGDDAIQVGGDAGVTVRAIAAPGHTEGSTIYLLENAVVFTGDILFVDGIGRPDLADKADLFAQHLYDTLHNVILELPDEVQVCPGHYGDNVSVLPDTPVSAKLGTLRGYEPFSFDRNHFVTWATSRASVRPPNYQEIILSNLGRRELSDQERHDLEMGPNRCSL